MVPPASSPPIRIISPHLYDSLTLYGTGSDAANKRALKNDIQKDDRERANGYAGGDERLIAGEFAAEILKTQRKRAHIVVEEDQQWKLQVVPDPHELKNH